MVDALFCTITLVWRISVGLHYSQASGGYRATFPACIDLRMHV
jgi:hypothetical protein